MVDFKSLPLKFQIPAGVFLCLWGLGLASWAIFLASSAMLQAHDVKIGPEAVGLFAIGLLAPILPFVEKLGFGGIADLTLPKKLSEESRTKLRGELERATERIAEISVSDLDYEKLAELTK